MKLKNNRSVINNAKYSMDFLASVNQERNKIEQISSASKFNFPMSSVRKKI